MKVGHVAIVVLFVTVPLVADDGGVLLPGGIVASRDSEFPLSVGVSLKRLALPEDGFVAWGAFELRGHYSIAEENSRISLSWPSLFGFFYPGVSIDIASDGIVPWFYGELDLLYFPFLFATMIIFEKPAFIPSVYLALHVNSSDSAMETGVRISFPVGLGDER